MDIGVKSVYFPGYRKYPKEIIIGEDIWTIKFCHRIPERHYGKEVLWGLCDPSELTIYIKYGLKRFELFLTFVL